MKELIMKLGTELEGKTFEEGKEIINNFDESLEIEIYDECNTAYYTKKNGASNEIERHIAKAGDTVLMSSYCADIHLNNDEVTVEYVQEYEIVELNNDDEDDLKFIKEGWRVWGYESNKN